MKIRFLLSLFVTLLGLQTVVAWNAAGHMIVAALSWQEMEPGVRDRAIAFATSGHTRFTPAPERNGP